MESSHVSMLACSMMALGWWCPLLARGLEAGRRLDEGGLGEMDGPSAAMLVTGAALLGR